MDPSSIIVIVIAITASAFFSGMEIAFITANRLKIELDNKKGSFSGKVLARFVKHDSRFIATMLLGNNIALVVYGIWMAQLMQPWISPLVGGSEAAVLLIQTVLSTLLILVTAEFLPKATFQINPNRMLQLLSFPLVLIYSLLYSFTIFIIFIIFFVLCFFVMDILNGVVAFFNIDIDHYV